MTESGSQDPCRVSASIGHWILRMLGRQRAQKSIQRPLNTKLQQNRGNVSWEICFILRCIVNKEQDIFLVEKSMSQTAKDRDYGMSQVQKRQDTNQVYLNIL